MKALALAVPRPRLRSIAAGVIAMLATAFLGLQLASAQTARVQIIHNSADPAAEVVDVYLDATLALNDFAFREATPFLDLPAGQEVVIGVAPGASTSSGDALATFPVTLTEGETYVVVASGVLSPGDFAANPNGRETAFTLAVLDGREDAGGAHATSVRPFHGVTDAPLVDVKVRDGASLMTARAYLDPTSYIGVPSAPIIIDVLPYGGEEPLASFEADLTEALGGAAVVLASGFLDPSANQDGAAFGLLAVFPDGTSAMLAPEEVVQETARVQIIHNAADPAAATVDIYLGEDLAIDNFAFRSATPFLDLPAGEEIVIGVAPGSSTSSGDALATFPVTLTADETYTVIANGVLSPGDFAANPESLDTGFNLWVTNSREASSDAETTEFYVVHGATDAPAVDVIARDVAALVEGASYGDITNYLSVAPNTYTLDINVAGTSTTVASFTADLSGAAGAAIGVLASGFLDPSGNQDGESFGLLAVFANGDTALLPAADPEMSARVQIIHNAADPAAATVDIYLGEDLAIDDFAFRSATPFLDLPAGEEIVIGVAPGSSTSSGDALATFPVTLTADETYTVIANGVLSPGDFSDNPDGRNTAFNLWVTPSREFANDTESTEFYVVHGATDAPAVDVVARDVATLVEGAAYGDITDYLGVAPDTYVLDVNVAGTSTTAASFTADLSGAAGAAIGVLASGFLDPAGNQDGEAFGLLAVFANGETAMLPVVEVESTARVQIIHNAADPAAATVDIYLGDALAVDDFEFRTATPFLDLPAGEEIVIGVAPGSSTSSEDAIATFPITLDESKTYSVVASGVLDPSAFAANPDGLDTGFTLLIYDNATETAPDAESVSLLIAHGATDAPAVDIRARDVGLLVEGAKYGDIASGLTVPAAAYTIDVLAAGTSTIVASFALDLTELGGGAAIAYASGFLDPSANGDGPGFQLGTTLADGSSATAAVVTSVDGDNTVPESLRLGGNYPNPFTGSTTIAFDLAENANVDVNVYDLTGRQVARVADSFTAGTNRQVVVDLADRPSGVYLYRLQVEGTTGIESVQGRMILTR
ncbi:MAG: DUF4397 domain-containing protein [Rhodothermales bacterium]